MFSESGISPCPSKVSTIKSAPPPTNVHELRSFLGMIQYCQRFIKDLATISEPLRNLTKKQTTWKWTKVEQTAFDQLKGLLTSDTTMAYFDPEKNTELYTDASDVGLGAIICQHDPGSNQRKIIAYASRSLTDVEKRYSTTEKEALAIVYATDKFRLYLFGHHFTLYTDHRPVQLIFGNPVSRPPARIERWQLRLQEFSFDIHYLPGPQNPADYLSRYNLPATTRQRPNSTEHYINFVTANATPIAMTTEQVKSATCNDPTMLKLRELLTTNKWYQIETIKDPNIDKEELKLFQKVKGDLTVTEDGQAILKNTRLVIPQSLRQEAIRLAHCHGHMGLAKTKMLIRSKIWFPHIDSMTKEAIDECIPCQSVTKPHAPAPLKMTKIPEEVWDTVSIDFMGPMPTGEYLLVLTDLRSRFPEVEIINNTSANTVIPKLEKIFSTFGLPTNIKTDNGPPFPGYKYKQFVIEYGIRHMKITPL